MSDLRKLALVVIGLGVIGCGEQSTPVDSDIPVELVEWRLGEFPSRIQRGETLRLSAERWEGEWVEIPSSSLFWTVSDEEIVQLEGNFARFVGVGEVQVEAKLGEDSKSTTLEVFEGLEVRILPEDGNIAIDARLGFDLEVQGSRVVASWSVVSGSEFGHVGEDGVLTGIAAGDVEIRACFATQCATRTVGIREISQLQIAPEGFEVIRVGIPVELQVYGYDEENELLLSIPRANWFVGESAEINELGVLLANQVSDIEVHVEVGEMEHTANFEARLFVSDLACTGLTCCAIDIRGQAFCMGEGPEMGNGMWEARSTNYFIPVNTDFRFREWIPNQGVGFCARLEGTEEIACWGMNRYGVFGMGHNEHVWTPTIVPWNFDKVLLNETPCGLTSSGELHCWGFEGDTLAEEWTTPTLKSAGPFSEIRGSTRTCVKDLEEVWSCFGDNDDGALGIPVHPIESNESNFQNELIRPDVEVDVVEIHSSQASTCGTDHFGLVRCWGKNVSLTLGVPDLLPWEVASSQRTSWSKSFDTLFGTQRVHCGMARTDQKVYCWGQGTHLGVEEASFEPVVLPIQDGVQKYVFDSGTTHALMENGDVWSWGMDWRNYRPGDGSMPSGFDNRVFEPYLLPHSNPNPVE